MFLSIMCNHDGAEHLRRLAPNETLDLRHHVNAWADRESEGTQRPSFAEPGAHIPNGCADWQAEIRRTKAATGSCWTSEPFYLESIE